MDSLELIKTFREVATQGGFSRAAKRLHMSKATVSKYVAELEERFGVRLLNRSTRSVSLTDAGELLLERSTPMLEMAALTQAQLHDRANQPSGRLRILASTGVSRGRIPDLLSEFLSHYPEVSLSLYVTNRAIDLAEAGIDLVLRAGPIQNENLIVRKLLQIDYLVCASPLYWREHSKPKHPSELAEHAVLMLSSLSANPYWRFESANKVLDISVKPRVDATDASPLVQMALHGAGVLYLPAVAVQSHIESGELEPVLSGFSRKDVWLYAAYLQRRHNSAALRALIDFLTTRLRDGQPSRQRVRR
ncbi:MAG: LysR family transcriptional regulator [Burkholderiaceae bacterium]|jgi:DNA-binding transcriptional LysR family regulator|nr:LysR family transcriptional regulator [Burkholderiaceae bacterium]